MSRVQLTVLTLESMLKGPSRRGSSLRAPTALRMICDREQRWVPAFGRSFGSLNRLARRLLR